MARSNSVNFTGGLQYPIANAATDLFHKEDLQVLAQAVDQHDHTTGKGLALSVGSIPDGSITSAKIADGTITSTDIADGTIQTVDLAAGAVSQKAQGTSDGSSYTRSIINSPAAVPGVATVTLTFTGQPVLILGQITMQHSVAGATAALGFFLDGVWNGVSVTQFPALNQNLMLNFVQLLTIATGSHTIALAWDNQTAGTLTRSPWWSLLIVEELKR